MTPDYGRSASRRATHERSRVTPSPPSVSVPSAAADPSLPTDSTLVPNTLAGLFEEITRIANDYDLRARIEEYDGAIADSFIWRDCIEAAEAIAAAAREGGDVKQAPGEAPQSVIAQKR